MTDFNDASKPNAAGTTTAREFAQEMGNFAESLRQSRDELSAEIAKIKTAKSEIQEEYAASLKGFVKNTLPALNGEQFDALNELTQEVPELGGQSLAFYRQKLLDTREQALQSVNQSQSGTLDASGFEQAQAAAQTVIDNALTAKSKTDATLAIASSALQKWKNTSEYEFVALDQELRSQGAPGLSPENRNYYAPQHVSLGYLKKWLTDALFKKVGTALEDYGHGTGGKDVFADMAANTKKTQDLTQTVTRAQAAAAASGEAVAKAREAAAKFTAVKDKIKTDDELLALVQDKVVSYLATPEFVKAVSDKYGEDFPRNLPLLSAKLSTLAKLQQGAEGKVGEIDKQIDAANIQARRAGKLRPYQELGVNLDAVRQQNAARRTNYDNYTRATRTSWSNTRSYKPSSTTVYVDRGPDYFDYLIMNEIMNGSQRHHGGQRTNDPTLAPYTADLLGVGKAQAEKDFGVPSSAFDLLPDTTGPSYTPSAVDQQVTSAFDLLPSSSSSHASNPLSGTTYREESTFGESSYRSNSPSFGSSS